jgi:CRISPR-associated endonuclease/helicase Cas3
MNYLELFKAATRTERNLNGFDPMAWQCRLACSDTADPQKPETLKAGVACESRLIDIPTGCGKTEGLGFAWLWNRVVLNKPDWPRRLVYCVPMRTLVEQTRERVSAWSRNLLDHADKLDLRPEVCADLRWLAEHSPIVLMGGEESDSNIREWDIHPEKPAILIGTQDMLLSRALNRGYAMRRPRWPIQFGLLNNDCLWICDEIQLMGPGVATACQLEAFRNVADDSGRPLGFASFLGSRSVTWYASATSNSDVLKTRDWRDIERPASFIFSLTDSEKADTTSVIGRRRFALKQLELHRDWHFGENQPPDERVSGIIKRHGEMVSALRAGNAPSEVPRRSLIICNRVDRAVAVFDALKQKQEAGHLGGVDLVLLHSRFRPADRKAQSDRLRAERLQNFAQGQIVVATQVIEAGVDLSSAILWTEIAPLSSLVQRLGRLNRIGEFGANATAGFKWEPAAIVLGIELKAAPIKEKAEEKKKREAENERKYLPYDQQPCGKAWTALPQLNGEASPAALESIRESIEASIEKCPYSLQHHELLDFFDTDSNLSLGYTDVSPFVRGMDEDTDVYVLWRDWDGDPNDHFRGDVGRDELCAVPISRLTGKDSFGNWRQHGWLWLRQEAGAENEKKRGKKGGWVSAGTQSVFPSATLLLRTSAGGYDPVRGWTGNGEDKPGDLYEPAEHPSDEDALSWLNHGWRSIALHVQDVRDALRDIFAALPNDGFITTEEKETCLKAALWHDIGKNHEDWKGAAVEALKEAGIGPPPVHLPLAKFSLSDSPQLKDAQGNLLTGKDLRRATYRLRNLFRPGMAHEVASALALRQRHIETAGHLRTLKNKDEYLAQLLAEYLVMSHHGQVRKVLRDEIPKNPKEEKSADTVRGVTEGDPLPAVEVEGEPLGCAALSVDCRRMGRDANGYESYTRGVLHLLDHYGPFRLAYLEALLRAADARASKDIAQ